LNVIAIYTDPTKFNAALEVATVVAGWTGGVGVPIVHTLIMMAWAMAESLFDVYLLLKGRVYQYLKREYMDNGYKRTFDNNYK